MSVMEDPMAALAGGGGAPQEQMPDLGASIATSADGSETDILKQAIAALQSFLEINQDDETQAEIMKIVAGIQGVVAKEQQLVDKATGAGPGERLVRKQTRNQQRGGGQGGY